MNNVTQAEISAYIPVTDDLTRKKKLLETQKTLQGVITQLYYLQNRHDLIKPVQLERLQELSRAQIEQKQILALLYCCKSLQELLQERTVLCDTADAVEALSTEFEALYGFVDDMELHGLTLDMLYLFSAEIDRYRDLLNTIIESIEAQDATRDMFGGGDNV